MCRDGIADGGYDPELPAVQSAFQEFPELPAGDDMVLELVHPPEVAADPFLPDGELLLRKEVNMMDVNAGTGAQDGITDGERTDLSHGVDQDNVLPPQIPSDGSPFESIADG